MVVEVGGGGRRPAGAAAVRGWSSGLQVGPAVVDELDHARQGREIAQLQVRVARDVVGLADGGEHLGLLDGVDAEIGFQVEIEIQHVLGIAGLLRDQVEHASVGRHRRSAGWATVGAGGAARAAAFRSGRWS